MADQYQWNPKFRARILASALQPDWFVRFGTTIIRPEYFELDEEQALIKFINAYYDAYHNPPDEDELFAEFGDDAKVQSLISLVLDFADTDLTYAQDQAIQFAKEQAAIIATLENVEDIKKGKLSLLRKRMDDALRVGRDMRQMGIEFRSTNDWMPRMVASVESGRVMTGIQHVDAALGGGLPKSEYTIILGGTNVGKTMVLVNIGLGASSIIQRANVTHITLELSEEIVAKRYAARVSDFFYNPDEWSYKDYIEELDDMIAMRMPHGNLRIKGFPSGKATIDDIENYLDLLVSEGYNTDLLIVDYADIMKHERVGELRQNLSNTTIGLRSLAQERKIAVVSASQSNREGLSSEFIDLQNMSEDIGKAFNTGLVLALCQTKLEYEENLARIFCAKNNDGLKGWVARCSIYPESHAIVSYELLSFSQILAESKAQRRQAEDDDKTIKALKEVANKKR